MDGGPGHGLGRRYRRADGSVTNSRGEGTFSAWDISVASIPPETPPAQTADNVALAAVAGMTAADVQEAVEELHGGKAEQSHSHATADVTGLDTALAGKSDTGHGHAIADTTGLQTALDGKQAASANLDTWSATGQARGQRSFTGRTTTGWS